MLMGGSNHAFTGQLHTAELCLDARRGCRHSHRRRHGGRAGRRVVTGRPPHRSPDSPDLTASGELRWLMRAWRDRLDRRASRMRSGLPRRPAKVTQYAVARRVGFSPAWYRNLEYGVRAGYSDAFLDKVARVLGLDSDERQVLYLLATGRSPAPRAGAPGVVTDLVAEIVQAVPWPAYIVDAAWDVQVHNPVMDQWFPDLRPVGNIMRLAFCTDAHRQLVDFEHDWAPALVGQMRAALARWQNHPSLPQLIADILATNPLARRLWDQPVMRIHTDGERRRLHQPGRAHPQHIEVVGFSLLRAENLRMIILVPAPAPAPPAPAAPATPVPEPT